MRASLAAVAWRLVGTLTSLLTATTRRGARRPSTPLHHSTVQTALVRIACARFAHDVALEGRVRSWQAANATLARLGAGTARLGARCPRFPGRVWACAGALVARPPALRYSAGRRFAATACLLDRARAHILAASAARFGARSPRSPDAHNTVDRAAVVIARTRLACMRARLATKARLRDGSSTCLEAAAATQGATGPG